MAATLGMGLAEVYCLASCRPKRRYEHSDGNATSYISSIIKTERSPINLVFKKNGRGKIYEPKHKIRSVDIFIISST